MIRRGSASPAPLRRRCSRSSSTLRTEACLNRASNVDNDSSRSLSTGANRANAMKYYQQFIELWKNADAELQPQVAEVKRRRGGAVEKVPLADAVAAVRRMVSE